MIYTSAGKIAIKTGVLLAGLLLLASCGKVGKLDRPEGDWDYPAQYPYPPSVTPATPSTPAQSTEEENLLPQGLNIRKNSRTKTTTYGN
ncbi:hypothetical protein O4H49_12730 [Kiloniella laminariae]|uniref:Lipoprotein n=1 Tax=Kiloniella laminariae TaxID=454162 RepID=A0ABT4LKL0_9PROT|nr:hypothetical protein [Kiloniella laminariae]MCZ4281648.1 hypothetical protein [Kiloniella laminariae]